MTSLGEMVQRLQEGAQGSADVLRDHLLEQGVPPDLVLDLVNRVWVGSSRETQFTFGYGMRREPAAAVLHEVFYSMVYDTIMVPGIFGAYGEFFRDLQGKYEDRTNLNGPRRIPFDAFRIKRVTLMGPAVEGSLHFQVNRASTELRVPLADIIARGVWGVPLELDLSSYDDLRGMLRVETPFGTLGRDGTYRLTLHGWAARRIN